MKGSTILKVFLVLLAVVFISNQLISSLYNPVKTDNAVYYTATDGFDITGVIIRNETLVTYSGDGVKHFVISDGNRVSKNGVIANVYDSESASIAVSERQNIENKIAEIEDILGYNDIEAANLDIINSKINDKINELICTASTGNYSNVNSAAEELLSTIWRRQAAMGESTDFSSQLDTLKAELSTPMPNAKKQIRSSKSGYFVSTTDGYESIFNTDDVSKITPELIDNAKPQKYGEEVVGKIVSDYEWYIAAKVSINDSLNYKEGDTLKLLTAVKSSPTLSVTVKKINISDAESQAVILFACNEMNSELASMRSGPMTVVKAQYSGLRIPRKALRVVDSVRGVYVLTGMQVSFVPIELIYSNESYIICQKNNDKEKSLKLYDKVIVKGKKLYDGKIVG